MIEQRKLGNSDISLSALSLGTVKFGRNQAVKYPRAFDLPSDQVINKLLGTAFEHGITTLDTAPAYGRSEERIGRLLTKRQQWQIISKAGEVCDQTSGNSHYDFSPKALEQSLEQSLRRLQTDYLDCWLLHSDGNDLANLRDEIVDVFLKAKQQGKVRSIGLSGKTVEGGEYALRYFDTVMMAASLENDREQALFDIAANKGKGLILKKIYDSGWALTKDNKQAVMRQTLARLFEQAAVCSAVIGTINPDHLLENINAYCHRHE